jgi:mannose-6-phosphate isomerase-like protein (cupin superfamily)
MSDSYVLPSGEGASVSLGGLGVRFMLGGDETGGGFSLVEHPIAPRALAAPLHTHSREDEYSFVLAGRVGVQLGMDEMVAGPGDLVRKPRGVPHAFWNAGEEPARVLELISPAGFERYFEELAPLLAPGGPPDLAALGELRARYGLTMDMDSVPVLLERHGLVFGPR